MFNRRFISAAVVAALVMGTFPVVPLADSGNLVYSVTFDEGGSAYTLQNGASLSDGKDGKAVRLDGEKMQYVKLADDITENLTDGYTISVDVYPENEANFARVFDLGTDTTNFAYFTCMGGGVPKYRYKGDDLFSDGVFLKQNEWNNVTITRDALTVRQGCLLTVMLRLRHVRLFSRSAHLAKLTRIILASRILKMTLILPV